MKSGMISLALVAALFGQFACKRRMTSAEKSIAKKDGQDMVVLQVNTALDPPQVQYKKCLAKDLEAAKAANPSSEELNVSICTGPDVVESLPENIYFGLLSVLLQYRDLSAEEKRLSWYYHNLQSILNAEQLNYEADLAVNPGLAKEKYSKGQKSNSIQELKNLRDSLKAVNKNATVLRSSLLEKLKSDPKISAEALVVIQDLAGKIVELENTRAKYAEGMMAFNTIKEHMRPMGSEKEKYVVINDTNGSIWTNAVKPFEFIQSNGGLKAFKQSVENYQWYNDFGADTQFNIVEALSACSKISDIARFPTSKELVAFYLQLIMKDSGPNPNSTEAKKFFANSMMWYWVLDDMTFSDSNFTLNTLMMSPKSGDHVQTMASALDFDANSSVKSLQKANLVCVANPTVPSVTSKITNSSSTPKFPKLQDILATLKSGKAAKGQTINSDLNKAKSELSNIKSKLKEAFEIQDQISAAMDDANAKQQAAWDTTAGAQFTDLIAELKKLKVEMDIAIKELKFKEEDIQNSIVTLEKNAAVYK